MPANTPNRQYPYPLGPDPIDVAGDIKRLAEAVDADQQKWDIEVWANGTFSSGGIVGAVGHCAMSLTTFKNFAAQDTWGIRPLFDGLYYFHALGIHAGELTGATVVSLSLRQFSNTAVLKGERASLTGGPFFWKEISHASLFRAVVGDFFRIGVNGDGGGTMDGRSAFSIYRVGHFVNP